MLVCICLGLIDGLSSVTLIELFPVKHIHVRLPEGRLLLATLRLTLSEPKHPDSHQPAKSNSIISIFQCFISCTFMLLLEYKVTKNSPDYQMFSLAFSVLDKDF